jgi:leucyl aminopeptidase
MQLVSDREISGRLGEVVIIHTQGKLPAQRIAVVGLGKRADLTVDSVRQASAIVAKRARDLHVSAYATLLLGLGEANLKPIDIAAATAEGALLALYKYEQFKKPAEPADSIQELVIVDPAADNADAARQGAQRGEALSRATNLARDLSNGPPNVVTPAFLADEARSVADRLEFICEVFGVDELRRRNMGGILAVGGGSSHSPCMIVMRYQGAPSVDKTFAVVGKGITFDSGGLDIKPADAMASMKHDMSGAAAVIGFMQTVAELKLTVNVIAVVSAAENLPSNNAYRPGDVISTSNGKTIEINNTDAEGRLVLADALSYVSEQKADAIVDLATLTGACIVALGTVASGVMGNNSGLISLIESAAAATGERVWAFPLWKEYGEQMKSDIADLKNTGGRWGGAITAGYFLSQFVGETPWAHLDIAGTAYVYPGEQPYFAKDRPYIPHGATGVGVRLLVDLVERWNESR